MLQFLHRFAFFINFSSFKPDTKISNIIKIDPYNFEFYRFKVDAFFETQCINHPLLVKPYFCRLYLNRFFSNQINKNTNLSLGLTGDVINF